MQQSKMAAKIYSANFVNAREVNGYNSFLTDLKGNCDKLTVGHN